MSHVAPPNLGNVIVNPSWRKIIYGIYVVAAVIIGGAGVYFPAVGEALPQIVVGAQAVIAYLAIPVGALALVNTPEKKSPFGDGEGIFQ